MVEAAISSPEGLWLLQVAQSDDPSKVRLGMQFGPNKAAMNITPDELDALVEELSKLAAEVRK
jgi:hypothetical protein